MSARSVVVAALALAGLALGLARSAEPATGFSPEVRVRDVTRLDWAFAAQSFPPAQARVSAAYDSRAQRYQLFVPATYKATATWPMIVFISPGDDPLGWRAYRKLCEDNDVLFCAAYAAGNNCSPGRRVRLVLDMLDDVRRRYRIDPDRTYLVGFSGGASLACTLAFALPEHFGGAVAISGAGAPPRLAYLRQRARERPSVAFLTGARDFKRRELEDYTAPLFTALGVRTRLWVVPKLGHALPANAVLTQAYNWLEDDLKRRRKDGAGRPGLAASADELVPSRLQAASLLAMAEADLRRPERTYRAIAELEMIVTRWGATEAAEKAQQRLRELRRDARTQKLLKQQAGAEERRTLTAEARAQERFGQTRAALLTWRALLKAHPEAPDADKVGVEIKRLSTVVARLPYLGATFEGDTTTVRAVVPGGPAYRGGLRRGDEVLRLGTVKVTVRADVERAFRAQRPGDRLSIEARRGGKTQTFTVVVGSPPLDD